MFRVQLMHIPKSFATKDLNINWSCCRNTHKSWLWKSKIISSFIKTISDWKDVAFCHDEWLCLIEVLEREVGNVEEGGLNPTFYVLHCIYNLPDFFFYCQNKTNNLSDLIFHMVNVFYTSVSQLQFTSNPIFSHSKLCNSHSHSQTPSGPPF